MGDYRDKSESERVDAPEKIDLTNIMLDVYHGVKRLWWLLIGLIIICAVQSYFSVSTSYQSKYVASATVSVTSVRRHGLCECTVCPADGGSVPVYSYQWCTEGCSC